MEEAIIKPKGVPKGYRVPYIDMLINGVKDTIVDIEIVGSAHWVGKSLHAGEKHEFPFNPYGWLPGHKFGLGENKYEIL